VTVTGGSAGRVVVSAGVVSVGTVAVDVLRVGVGRVALIPVESAPRLPPPPHAATKATSIAPEITTAARLASPSRGPAERLTLKRPVTVRPYGVLPGWASSQQDDDSPREQKDA
jgi:hypothetical protein